MKIQGNLLIINACDVDAALNESLVKSPTMVRKTKDSLSMFLIDLDLISRFMMRVSLGKITRKRRFAQTVEMPWSFHHCCHRLC